jgi:hypothetical protein
MREMKVSYGAGEPVFILGISAVGRRGTVSVRREGEAEVQSLGCALLRDEAEATQQELAAAREQFVTQIELVNALEEFRALDIEFISLHEGVDTGTPNGRLVFGIFASIAEFERELIRDRVRSGLAAAKAKGRRVGRPRVVLDALRIASLRGQGRSWAEITEETEISKGTAQRALAGLPKTPVADTSPSA